MQIPMLSPVSAPTGVIFAILVFILGLMPATVLAIENDLLTTIFKNYEESTNLFIQQMHKGEWESAQSVAVELGVQSAFIHQLAVKEDIQVWENYASNLRNHCRELEHAAQQQNVVQATRLVAILIGHIEQIQSANPLWLDFHLSSQLNILEKSIRLKDAGAARDSAEAIHTSATKIALSVMSAGDMYHHTRWLSNIQEINGLGDAILGEVNQGKWEDVGEKLAHIRHIIGKWQSSFWFRSLEVSK